MAEKRYRKRMAQVATVYTIAPWVRTPMDIMHEPPALAGRSGRRGDNSLFNKRVWASLAKRGAEAE